MRVGRIGVFVYLMSVSATALGQADVSRLARGAPLVVVGSVVDVSSRFATNAWGDQLIVSTAAIEVEETLKGPRLPVVRVTFEGGTVGDLTLTVSDIPALRTGDRAVMFLETGPWGFVPHGRGEVFLVLDARERVQHATAVTLADVRRAVRSVAR